MKLKEPAQLDAWPRHGLGAVIDRLCGWVSDAI
jgi:hypothetical protein